MTPQRRPAPAPDFDERLAVMAAECFDTSERSRLSRPIDRQLWVVEQLAKVSVVLRLLP